jgi:hypothetical protein
MPTYIGNRIAALEKDLNGSASQLEPQLQIGLIKIAVEDIREHLKNHPFPDKEEEIHYFKKLAPPVYARLFYLQKVADTQIEWKLAGKDRMQAYLNREIANVEQFFHRHSDFCHYYHMNKTHWDDRIFIRDARENGRSEHVEVIMADDFCVGCYLAALLLANQELNGYFQDQLHRLQQGAAIDTEGPPTLEWTDGKSDLVELLYGLWVKGSFNNGKAPFKDIISSFQKFLKIDLGNYSDTVSSIARRKKGTVKFLDDLRDRLVRKLEEMA